MSEELKNVKKATAILISCVVESLNETDPHFRDRFLDNLAYAYGKIRNDSDDLNALELLNWTREMITGFNRIEGQKEPFFDR